MSFASMFKWAWKPLVKGYINSYVTKDKASELVTEGFGLLLDNLKDTDSRKAVGRAFVAIAPLIANVGKALQDGTFTDADKTTFKANLKAVLDSVVSDELVASLREKLCAWVDKI